MTMQEGYVRMNTICARPKRIAQRMFRGKLIVLEGPDGVGKSAIAVRLTEQVDRSGRAVQLLSFPGQLPGTVGSLVYSLHHDPASYGVERLTPTALQALHVAAHLDVVEERILPALKAGTHVILDRFWWSAWVYGTVGGVNPRVLQCLIEAERLHLGADPDAVILLRRDSPLNRDHVDGLAWNRLRDEYDRLAQRESRRYVVHVVDNAGPIDLAVRRGLAVLETAGMVPAHPECNRSSVVVPKGPNTQLPSHTAAPSIISRCQLRPTQVYDTYWRFAAERQEVFFRRLSGKPAPWTDDPIIREYKFTNAYRASDRVSQYLIRNVIYRDDLPKTPDEVFFRTILFKLFNKIETWEHLQAKIGAISFAGYEVDLYDRVLTKAMASGRSIYSAAYIMPSGGGAHPRKHYMHLRLLEKMMHDRLPDRLAELRSMEQAFQLMRSYPTIGDFLAYQYITDVNYSEVTPFSEMEFVVPGPGARDGIRKCFSDLGRYSEADVIREVTDRQREEFARLGLSFRSLWGRPLQLIDCQNLFCEVDKYARVRHPEVQGITGRTRIKQRYHPKTVRFQPWYPPKWGINGGIPEEHNCVSLF